MLAKENPTEVGLFCSSQLPLLELVLDATANLATTQVVLGLVAGEGMVGHRPTVGAYQR